MTHKCNGILQVCALLATAAFAISGCNLMHEEVPVGSAESGQGSLQGGAQSLVVEWSAPTQYDDGSPLMDLSGYKVYYGTTSSIYDRAIEINQIGLTTYVIDGISPGTYYLAMTSINSAGTESVLSSEVTRTVF